jgi:hypothetical protein
VLAWVLWISFLAVMAFLNFLAGRLAFRLAVARRFKPIAILFLALLALTAGLWGLSLSMEGYRAWGPVILIFFLGLPAMASIALGLVLARVRSKRTAS